MTAPTAPDRTTVAAHATASRLPAMMVIASAMVAMFGFHWDIAWHSD